MINPLFNFILIIKPPQPISQSWGGTCFFISPRQFPGIIFQFLVISDFLPVFNACMFHAIASPLLHIKKAPALYVLELIIFKQTSLTILTIQSCSVCQPFSAKPGYFLSIRLSSATLGNPMPAAVHNFNPLIRSLQICSCMAICPRQYIITSSGYLNN